MCYARCVVRARWLVGAALLLEGLGTAAHAVDEYRYRVSWNGIPAARAIVTASTTAASAEPVVEVRVQMETNAFVDLFWKLRASARAEVDTATWQTRLFEYDRRINGRPELTRVTPESDGQVVGRYARPGRYRLMVVNRGEAIDPVSGIALAQRELAPIGETRTYDVFTGESRYRIALRSVALETVNVPAGRFRTVRLEPTLWRLDSNAAETRVRRMTIWVAETAPHTLLRARSQVFVGAIYLDLVSRSRGSK